MRLRTGLALLLVLLTGAVVRYTRAPLLAGHTFSQQVLDRHGQVLRLTLSGDEKYRLYTPLARIAPAFVEAVLLREDRHFYAHPGVNPLALARAALSTYYHRSRRVGGSTITMQLVRLTSTRGSKTLLGKLVQIGRALYLDALYSKEEILEAYLNLLPYGANIEGVGAAAWIYFNKPADRLSLLEGFRLAIVPQNPNRRSPLNPDLSHEADRMALRALHALWLKHHPQDRGIVLDAETPLAVRGFERLPFHAPHFVNHVLERAAALRGLHGRPLHTTLDLGLQQLLERKIRAFVRARDRWGIDNASALLVDGRTMDVLAMVGSVDFFAAGIEGQVNGTLARRSPGSTLKPFVYALALDQGLIHARSLLKDTPMSFGGFDPENADRDFSGPLTATEALARSRNVPAVYLSAQLKQSGLYDFLKRAGIKHLREAEHYGLSLSLGGAEVTMADLAKLYAMLSRGGEVSELRLFMEQPPEAPMRLLSREASFITLDMLRTNAREDVRWMDQWLRDPVSMAWKTGTSQGFRDAWTAGLVGPYVLVVWLGHFDNTANPMLRGRELAAPLFFQIADGLKASARQAEWRDPTGLKVKKVKVCAVSGQLPGRHCSHQHEAWFIPGTSPIATCSIHREVLLTRTGQRACSDAEPGLSRQVVEFWPSDLLQVFRRAGIPRRTPPAFADGCSINETQNQGLPPAIVSPKLDVAYALRASASTAADEEKVPLMAIADGDAARLHWFVGTEYLGEVDAHKPWWWTPKPGRHIVRVVDDLGRSDTRTVEVRVSR